MVLTAGTVFSSWDKIAITKVFGEDQLICEEQLVERDLSNCGMMLRNERDGQMGEAFKNVQLPCSLFQ